MSARDIVLLTGAALALALLAVWVLRRQSHRRTPVRVAPPQRHVPLRVDSPRLSRRDREPPRLRQDDVVYLPPTTLHDSDISTTSSPPMQRSWDPGPSSDPGSYDGGSAGSD